MLDMDNSTERIIRDMKLIVVLGVAIVGGGWLVLLLVSNYPAVAFAMMILVLIGAIVTLLSTR
jgi:hypothetical protein